jgi:predicted GNAT family acetyltransferase
MADEIRDNRERGRFELEVDGHIVFADYRRQGDRLLLPYVEAAPRLRGTGAAGRLMAAIAERARAEGIKLVPLCGYARAWLRRHKEHHDLLAPDRAEL